MGQPVASGPSFLPGLMALCFCERLDASSWIHTGSTRVSRGDPAGWSEDALGPRRTWQKSTSRMTNPGVADPRVVLAAIAAAAGGKRSTTSSLGADGAAGFFGASLALSKPPPSVR